MVRQERDRRGPERGGDQGEPGHLAPNADLARGTARKRAARDIFEHERRGQSTVDNALVRPGFRERVEESVRGRWHEPVVVLRLDERVDLGFAVPGRRLDGTVKGKRLVRRFLWNIVRGVGGATATVFTLFNGGGAGNPFAREIRVTGPANAEALELLDSIRGAAGPWLACSPSHLAVVDTGATFVDPADAPPPRILWHATRPRCPRLSFRTNTITWPDGSTFRFPLHGRAEVAHLRGYHELPDTMHWDGRPRTEDADGSPEG